MSDYRRLYYPGGVYFFTAVTASRQPLFTEASNVDVLRNGFRHVMARRPFKLEAIVILPDHIHCIWRMPEEDADFSNRWKMLKGYVTRHLKGASGRIWQSRFWEHVIRDDEDWRRHMDYIHYNPVKHGLVNDPDAWPFSSYKRYLELGYYAPGWGESEPRNIAGIELE
ncbi:REP-associated tyrosine transposase [Thiohalophilus thiocyanatoxydans]|uniref:Putative transposase n=1 Tax=Thiohalophilus thiocyanatoxydans TaxID=381308 RepID=A0A4V3H4N3_9GAMM|nr:transposase [Thiohalophilus thiocyanatoxydans]TDY03845.1 putative transposase [Thiohalophilus thiocyanatoxydans]